MPYAVIYASPQACAPVLELALRLRAQGHQLRSLGQLPKPLPARVASLRLELAALRQIERTLCWVLGQYAEHRRLPDAARERDLRADLELTRWQMRDVTAALEALTPPRALA